MYSIPTDAAYVGDYVTPHPLNSELAEIMAASNALNHDNIDSGLLTPDQVAPLTYGSVLVRGGETTRTTTHDDTPSISDIFAVPDEAGDDWVEQITCGDSVLRVVVNAEYQRASDGALRLWLGARVDGALVAMSHIGDQQEQRDARFAEAVIPVASGTHTIEVVYGLHPLSSTGSLSIEWLYRILTVREAAR